MWRSPNHPDYGKPDPAPTGTPRAPTQAPPPEQGRRLAAFERRGQRGERSELRVSLDEYQGHPYISVRLWTHDPRSGGWWPSKKGVTVRLGEAQGVADALIQAVELVGIPEKRPAKGNRELLWEGREPARAASGSGGFDEFGGLG